MVSLQFKVRGALFDRPVCPLGKLQRVQQGACDALQMGQYQSLKCLHDHRSQGDGPVVIQSSDGMFLRDWDDGGLFEASTRERYTEVAIRGAILIAHSFPIKDSQIQYFS